ncbi:MAG: hypothetical protein GY816_16325, partial [Cytophagales bacterium]|nr:hypothetical protein [Cytophagales bacterium]
MKKYASFVGYALLSVAAGGLLLILISTLAKGILKQESFRLVTARESSEISMIAFRSKLDPILIVAGYSAFYLALFTLVTGGMMALINKTSVHHAEIGHSKIPIHKKDLPRMTPVLTTLATAEQMEKL